MIYINTAACVLLSFLMFVASKIEADGDKAKSSFISFALCILFGAAAIINILTILK